MVRRRTSPRKKRAAYAKLDSAAPARRGGALVILLLGALVLLNLYVFVWNKRTSVEAIKAQALAGSDAPKATPKLTIDAPALDPEAADPVAAVDGHVARSDTLGKLLKRSGLTGAEADDVIHALSGVLDFRTIKAGAAYHLERGRDGKVTRFDLELSKNHHVRVVRGTAGLVGSADPM